MSALGAAVGIALGGDMDHGTGDALPLFRRCSFGAHVGIEPHGSAPGGLGEHYALEARLGARLQRMVWYQDMDAPWPEEAAAQAARSGHTPHIAWDTGPRVRLAQIVSGERDQMLDDFFVRARAFPGTVVLRMWWEMNADAGRYALAYRGGDRTVDSLEQFHNAWRHVHHRCRTVVGATNVQFLFCVNGSDVGPHPMEDYYPGSDVVDRVGVNTFNETVWEGWMDFTAKLAPMYDRVAALHPTAPVDVAELGSVAEGVSKTDGDLHTKAVWLQGLFTTRRFPRLRHVDFFSVRKEEDWRIDATAASLEVSRRYLQRSPRYVDGDIRRTWGT